MQFEKDGRYNRVFDMAEEGFEVADTDLLSVPHRLGSGWLSNRAAARVRSPIESPRDRGVVMHNRGVNFVRKGAVTTISADRREMRPPEVPEKLVNHAGSQRAHAGGRMVLGALSPPPSSRDQGFRNIQPHSNNGVGREGGGNHKSGLGVAEKPSLDPFMSLEDMWTTLWSDDADMEGVENDKGNLAQRASWSVKDSARVSPTSNLEHDPWIRHIEDTKAQREADWIAEEGRKEAQEQLEKRRHEKLGLSVTQMERMKMSIAERERAALMGDTRF